jgi:hypothetical protein
VTGAETTRPATPSSKGTLAGAVTEQLRNTP